MFAIILMGFHTCVNVLKERNIILVKSCLVRWLPQNLLNPKAIGLCMTELQLKVKKERDTFGNSFKYPHS